MSRMQRLSSNNGICAGPNDWTLSDKKALIEAIKSYGFDNLQKIAEVVQTKSISEIESFMNKRKARARQLCAERAPETSCSVRSRNQSILENSDDLTPIKFWSFLARNFTNTKYRKNDYADIFSDIFRNAANSESHVEPRSPEEPNFKALYNYLASLLSGSLTPPELSATDSAVLCKLFSDLHNFISTADLSEEKDFLERILGMPEFVCLKDKQKETTDPSSSTSETNFNVASEPVNGKNEVFVSSQIYGYLSHHKKIQENLNPFCIPLKLLEKEQLMYENDLAEEN